MRSTPYIAQDNPAAALRIVQQVLRRSWQIAALPGSGRRVPDYAREDVRELIEGQYRIVYRILPTRIDVLTVMHVAQLLPTDVQGFVRVVRKTRKTGGQSLRFPQASSTTKRNTQGDEAAQAT